MAIDSSKFFDSIRVKPTKTAAKQKAAREEVAYARRRAARIAARIVPKGRGQEKDYWHFCLNHVREYNQVIISFRV
jgi:hypothetical protein